MDFQSLNLNLKQMEKEKEFYLNLRPLGRKWPCGPCLQWAHSLASMALSAHERLGRPTGRGAERA
jgi:hypothetical protein